MKKIKSIIIFSLKKIDTVKKEKETEKYKEG